MCVNMRKVNIVQFTILVMVMLLLCSCCDAFNVDTRFPIIFNGSEGSYYGYTTALHKNRWGYLALIGAPRANTTTISDSVYQPGTVFRCNITKNSTPSLCQEIFLMQEGGREINRNYETAYEDKKDNMWLGVTLDVRPGKNDIVTCGHLWKNKYHRQLHLVNGVCYVINGNLEEDSVKKLLPLTQRALQYGRDSAGSTEYNHAYGQAGMSLAFSQNGSNLILGAPGVWSWTGSIVNYGMHPDYSNDLYRNPVVPQPPYEVNFNAYFGYSVTTGRFFENKQEYIAVGAPKDGYNGRVYVARQIGNNLRIHHRKQGLQMGEYFGASVLGVNLNGDSFTDLLVGAPLNSLNSGGDEGIVYVYISNGKVLEKYTELTGDKIADGRFGTAMAIIGDLNQDGFSDIAIGAPYEDKQGAVYIYHGSSSGIRSKYAQKIEASSFNSRLSGFGVHISRGMDIDSNGYPDILIGSYASSNAVLLRSRSIIRVFPAMTFNPNRISINETMCDVAGTSLTCVQIDACLRYSGKHAPSSLDFRFTVSIIDPSRRGFFTEKRIRETSLNVVLDIDTKTCSQFTLYLNEDIKDVITPVTIQFSHKLVPPADFEKRFKKTFPIYHPLSLTNITSEIPFHTGCGRDDECYADLIVSATRIEPLEERLITIGKFPRITVQITVKNVREPAYLSELLLYLPPELPSIKHDYFCDTGNQQNNASLVCSLGNPLRNGTQVDITIKLDATKIPPHTKYLEIVCKAVTLSTESNPDDNTEIVPIHLETKADIAIIGLSSDNQIMYNGNRDSSPIIRHTYTIRNHGPSPLQNIDIFINIPYKFITSDGKKQIISFTSLEIGSETQLSIPAVCEDVPLNLKHVQSKHKNKGKTGNDDREFLLNDKGNSSNVLARSDSAGEAPNNLVQNSDVQPNVLEPKKELVGNNTSSFKARGYVTINCFRRDVECIFLRCSATAFTNPRKFSQISLGFQFNFTTLDDYLNPWYHIEYFTSGHITVSDETVVQLHDHPDSTDVITRILHEGPPPPEELAPWIVFVSVAAGVALLLIILIVLIKVGFFKRKEKDQMKEMLCDTKQGETNPGIDDAEVPPQPQ